MKNMFKSRTLWVNLIAAIAFFVQSQYGYVIDPSTQAMILSAVNFLLRLDTSEAVYAVPPDFLK